MREARLLLILDNCERLLGAVAHLADALALLGVHALELGECDAARRLQEQSLAFCRQLDDQTLTASVLIRLGQVAHTVGDQATAMTRYTEGLQLARATENHSDVGRAFHHLGALALDRGDCRGRARGHPSERARPLAASILRVVPFRASRCGDPGGG